MKAYPAYKDSGLAWMPEIPEHWEKYRTPRILKNISVTGSESDELLSVYLDKGVIKHSESDGSQVHKPSKDMSDYQKVIPGNLVCNNQQAWRGSVGVSSYEGRISPAYVIFELSSEIYSGYANYLFRSQIWKPAFVYSSKGVGSIQRNLYLPWFRHYCCYLPPIEEQNAIVSYLDKKCAEIEELISRKRAIIERLKELKQSFIAETVTKGLNPDVPMKESGLTWMPEVPKHWHIIKLRNLLHKFSQKGNPDLPLLSVVRERGVILRDVASKEENHNFIPDDLSKYKVLLDGQFVINKMKAWQGSYAVSALTGIVSPAYFIYNIDYSNLLPRFFNVAIRSKAYISFFNQSSDGVRIGQWDLDETKMRNIPFLVPPKEEQHAIVAYLDKKCAAIDELVSRHEQTIEKLKELKTATIADVVTGKVDVRESI